MILHLMLHQLDAHVDNYYHDNGSYYDVIMIFYIKRKKEWKSQSNTTKTYNQTTKNLLAPKDLYELKHISTLFLSCLMHIEY